jgi:hypothetical protein
MWSFRRSNEEDRRRLLLAIGVGTATGLAAGFLVAGRRAPEKARELGSELRTRVKAAAARLSPERRIRTISEETELGRLEDAVIDAYLNDATLSERGIEVGAISRGIIELTGSVWSEDEADLAVRVANGVTGVQTVVNRLEVETESRQREVTRRRFEEGDPALMETRWEGRRVGMGRTRQSRVTEPDRPDDSQKQVEKALEQADRDHWRDEGLAADSGSSDRRARGDRQAASKHRDDDLDHQDPAAAGNAPETLQEQPQDLRGRTRVGEGLKPGTELILEDADLPVKPHGDPTRSRSSSGPK